MSAVRTNVGQKISFNKNDGMRYVLNNIKMIK